jgi:hypothetical protein
MIRSGTVPTRLREMEGIKATPTTAAGERCEIVRTVLALRSLVRFWSCLTSETVAGQAAPAAQCRFRRRQCGRGGRTDRQVDSRRRGLTDVRPWVRGSCASCPGSSSSSSNSGDGGESGTPKPPLLAMAAIAAHSITLRAAEAATGMAWAAVDIAYTPRLRR